ncbi:DMT family transporter [Modicisalibacter luteus]|uniref:DMT family transporter n=1 Tax=Modicisalibacter luteus TaxID=453962 RepID=A0ABV7LVH2_9GAMM|nr:EamA family transporter [Halomonas lutea]GHB06166.1 drug/metabolite transporter 3 [Halomonas lutea]
MTGSAWIIIAAFLWGIGGGLAGILIERGWDPLVVAFYQGAIGFVCLFAWLLLQPKRRWKGSRALTGWSVLAGLGIAANFALYFIGIEQANVAVAATLMYTAPIYVYLVSFIARLERPTLAKWLCILLVMAGTVLLTGLLRTDASSVSLAGIAAGIGAGLAYAVFIFSFKYASLYGQPHLALNIVLFTVVVALFPFIDYGQSAAAAVSSDIGWFLLLGLFGAGLSFLFYLYGLRRTSPTIASIIAMVEPATASLFGVVILGEALSLAQGAGMAIILLTVTYLSTCQA